MPSLGHRTQMSSRLANMKFMQRGDALAATRSGSAPSTPNGPPAKRMRLSTGASPAVAYSDAGSPGSVMSQEDSRHQEALERQAQEAGETQWVLKASTPRSALSRPPLQIVSMSLADLDTGKEDGDAEDSLDAYRAETVSGRMTFGKKGPPAPAQTSEATSEAELDDEEGLDYGSDNPHSREERQRASQDARNRLAAKRSNKSAESNRLAEIRRKRPGANLNGNALSVLSGKTNQMSNNRERQQRDKVSRAQNKGCFRCGGDHFAKNCPKP